MGRDAASAPGLGPCSAAGTRRDRTHHRLPGYELCWEYGPHTAAGEDIRIIPVTGGWPDDVPPADFTLFDSRLLFRLDYAPDGAWLGAELINDPADVAAACFARDAALHHTMPWAEYMPRHPDLVRRLPKSGA